MLRDFYTGLPHIKFNYKADMWGFHTPSDRDLTSTHCTHIVIYAKGLAINLKPGMIYL